MALFGSFETEREVYSDPIYTVYSARKSGDPASEYAIKVFSIQRIGFDEETTLELAPLLIDIESARIQCIDFQTRGAAASKFIAPVFEKGQDERGVWYVTRFYPRSVNKLIMGRVALTRDALHHLIRAMAQGALDFKRAGLRSHGDIRPSNIQISKSEKLTEAEVVLSDPLPGGEEEAVSFEVNDLRSIGRILLQLVLQRAITNEDDFLILPILSSPEWTKLFGKDTEAWLSICNRLLDPNLSLEEMTLDRLVADLQRLEPKAKVPPKVLATATTGVLAFAALCLLVFWPGPKSIPVTSDPPGAKILVNQKEHTGRTPMKLKLAKGKYLIEAQNETLGALSTNWVVGPGMPPAIHFQFPYGSVALDSQPPNATVEMDGKPVGSTPYKSGPLAPGQRTFTIRLADYEPLRLPPVVVPTDGRLISVPTAKLNRRKPGDGSLEISSVPDGAEVYEGTQDLGPTPMTKFLSAGAHQITARFPGWPETTISTQVTVAAASPLPVEFHFPYSTLRFDVTPPEAEILLNQKPLGVGRDISRRILPPGEYSVLLTNAGYYPVEQKIVLRNGDSKPVDVALKAMLGIVEFITDPAGATIFSAKEQDKPLGQTQPGQPLKLQFRPGSYSFIARYKGLDDVLSPTINVPLGGVLRQQLPFTYGTLDFSSIPDQAMLLLAGTIKERTPYSHRQKPGPVTYHVEAEDYYPLDGSTNVVSGKVIPITFHLRPKDVPVLMPSDPPGARFYLNEAPIFGTNDSYRVPWGPHSITAKYPVQPGLPQLDPIVKQIEVDKNGTTTAGFDFKYAILEITNIEPEAKLSYQGVNVTNLPARLVLKPDLPGELRLDYGADFSTNLPIRLAAGRHLSMGVVLPELRRNYTNKANMVFIRVSRELYVEQTEVTEEAYRSVRNEPLQAQKMLPAVNIGWQDAQKFCDTLTTFDTGSLQRQKLSGWKYSLPNEEDWKSYADPSPEVLSGSIFSQSGRSIPAEIDFNRKSAGKLGLYDVFGNAAEWCLGTSGQAITLGGSVTRSRPKPERVFSLKEENLPPDSVQNGSPTIGFRCVLKRMTP